MVMTLVGQHSGATNISREQRAYRLQSSDELQRSIGGEFALDLHTQAGLGRGQPILKVQGKLH